MRVYVDQVECTGAGHCETLAPAVFTIDDDGLATVIHPEHGPLPNGGAEAGIEISPGSEELVRDAADVCPGACIHLIDTPSV